MSVEPNNDKYELLKKRYNRETGGRAIYGRKETKGFKKWKEYLIEKQKEVHEKLEHSLENSDGLNELKEEWAESLIKRINEFSDEELSKESKEELSHIIENYSTLKIIVKYLPLNFRQIIEDLRLFKATYSVYKERGYVKSIPLEVGRAVKKLKKSLKLFKNKAIVKSILDNDGSILQKFKDDLRENLYKSTILSIEKKSKINTIIQKEKLTEQDKEELFSILGNLPEEELNSLSGGYLDIHWLNKTLAEMEELINQNENIKANEKEVLMTQRKKSKKKFEVYVDEYRKIIKDPRIVKIYQEKGIVSSRDLENNGFKDFIRGVYKDGYSYDAIVEKVGRTPFSKQRRDWSTMILQDFAQELLEIIDSLKENGVHIENGFAPTGKILIDNDYSKFFYATFDKKKQRTYNKVVRAANLKVSQDKDSIFKTYTLTDLAKELIKIQKSLRPILNLGEKEAPSREQLRNNGYEDYANHTYNKKKNITYTKIIIETGLEPNVHSWDNCTIDDLADYLLEILDSGLRQKLRLKKDQAPTQYQLTDYGFGYFLGGIKQVSKRTGVKLSYNTVVLNADLLRNYVPDKWEGFELEDFSVHFRETFDRYNLRKKLNLNVNEAPTRKQCYDNDLGDLVSALPRYGIKSFSKFMRATGLSPRYDDRNIHIGKTFKNFISEFNKIREDLGFEGRNAPVRDYLRDHGYGYFPLAMSRYTGLNYGEFLDKHGLDPNIDPTRFEPNIFDTYNFAELAIYLKNTIYPSLKNVLGLREGEAPTLYQMKNNGFNDYRNSVIHRSNVRFLDLVETANLRRNYQRRIDYSNYTFDDFVSEFEEIIDCDLKITLNLKDYEGPRFQDMIDYGYQSLINAILYRKIKYSKLVRALNLTPRDFRITVQSGIHLHWIYELQFIEFANLMNWIAFWEIKPSYLSGNNNRVDNAIIPNLEFINHCKNSEIEISIPFSVNGLNSPNGVKLVGFDYTMGDSRYREEKCYKNYHNEYKFLNIIALLNPQNQIETPSRIPYRRHAKILNAKEFICFVGYDRVNAQRFLKMLGFARKAIVSKDGFYSKEFMKLENIAFDAQTKLYEKYKMDHRQKALVNYLKRNCNSKIFNRILRE